MGRKLPSKLMGVLCHFVCMHNISLYEIQTLLVLCANTQNITIARYQKKEG
jgi:hypothetical protein